MASAEREAAVTAEGGGCIVGDSGDGVDRQQQQRPGRQRGQKQRRRWGQTTINQNAVAVNSRGNQYGPEQRRAGLLGITFCLSLVPYTLRDWCSARQVGKNMVRSIK
jgi:hypothetical protein